MGNLAFTFYPQPVSRSYLEAFDVGLSNECLVLMKQGYGQLVNCSLQLIIDTTPKVSLTKLIYPSLYKQIIDLYMLLCIDNEYIFPILISDYDLQYPRVGEFVDLRNIKEFIQPTA